MEALEYSMSQLEKGQRKSGCGWEQPVLTMTGSKGGDPSAGRSQVMGGACRKVGISCLRFFWEPRQSIEQGKNFLFKYLNVLSSHTKMDLGMEGLKKGARAKLVKLSCYLALTREQLFPMLAVELCEKRVIPRQTFKEVKSTC